MRAEYADNPLMVDTSHLIDDDLEFYDYADSLAERQRLAHEIDAEMRLAHELPVM